MRSTARRAQDRTVRRSFVLERAGNVKIIEDGQLLPTPFVDRQRGALLAEGDHPVLVEYFEFGALVYWRISEAKVTAPKSVHNTTEESDRLLRYMLVDNLAVLTPCFRGDAHLFGDLHESVLANAGPAVVHHVVVPPSDARLFRHYEGPRCRVWTHRDLLPRYCVPVPHLSGLMINCRRPWPPVRGWVVQQLMKIAATAEIDARAVLIIDSDAVLLREPKVEELYEDDRLRFFREDNAVTADMKRHVLWHGVARRLLGLPTTACAPLPDYVSPICLWDPAVVRAMMEHIAARTGRPWLDSVAAELHVSEFVIYGVFVDEILGGASPVDGLTCHNYYQRSPLDRERGHAFARQMPSTALGAMISSHSHTPAELRREIFRECARALDGDALAGANASGLARDAQHR